MQVPYRGAVPGIADLVAGQIPVMFTTTGDLLPHYRPGKARLLATSRLAGSIRPANSLSAGLMPLSTTPILIPAPVAPAL